VVVYAVPLAGLLGGAAVGQDLAGRLLVSNVELFSIGAGLLGLVAALAWVWRFTRRIADDADYEPVILRRTVPADALVTGVMDTGLNH
jgi:positive regulator of sigma E activity